MFYFFSVALLLVLVIQGVFPLPSPQNFDGYQVYRIKVETEGHLKTIRELETLFPSIDYWNEPEVGRYADIMISPPNIFSVSQFLRETHSDLSWIVWMEDVGKIINEQQIKSKSNRDESENFWIQYNPLDTIYGWMNSLEFLYPNLVSTQTIGYSYEQRHVRLLKVSNNSNDASRPSVFLDSGIHAREWISPATLTYIIHNLITDSQYSDILESLDIYAVPVLNPDGYEYTHTTNRMWRKNRRPTPGTDCFGADLNRNFPFQWCTLGASNDSCAETYCGSEPGSEPETRVITDFLLRNINWWGYVTLHSYGQEWCIPWAYTATHHEDYDDMMALGRKAVDQLEAVHGTNYTLKIPSGRYGGFSMDWAKGVRNIKYPVLIELRDTGTYGFLLPAEQIIPSGDETLAAISAYLRGIIAELPGNDGNDALNLLHSKKLYLITIFLSVYTIYLQQLF